MAKSVDPDDPLFIRSAVLGGGMYEGCTIEHVAKQPTGLVYLRSLATRGLGSTWMTEQTLRCIDAMLNMTPYREELRRALEAMEHNQEEGEG